MWVFRSHKIGTPYKMCYKKVRQRYIAEVERGVLPTHQDMEEWIDRKMNERTTDATFSIEVTDEIADATMVQESMDSYYNDMTRGAEVECIGVRTRKRIKCVICRNSKHTKIRVTPCNHIFHRKCIDEWLRWSRNRECPICKVQLQVKGESNNQ